MGDPLRARALARDPRAVRAVRRLVEQLERDETPALDVTVEALPKLLGAEIGCAYRFGIGPAGPQLDFVTTSGAPPAFGPKLGDFAARSKSRRISPGYDALRPPRSQRNVAVVATEVLSERLWERHALRTEVMAPVGMERHHHVRVLLCDGSHLLAWVGVLGTGRYGARELGILDALAGPLAARLGRELPLPGRSIAWGTLDAALDQIDAPAFLVRGDHAVVRANALGKRLLDAGAIDVAARIAAATAGLCGDVKLTPIRLNGLPPHVLVVIRRPRDDFGERLARAAELWGLTPRQREVLALLARGEANKGIAERLRCSVKTVELHVSALLHKGGAESRAEVVARFWTLEG